MKPRRLISNFSVKCNLYVFCPITANMASNAAGWDHTDKLLKKHQEVFPYIEAFMRLMVARHYAIDDHLENWTKYIL